MKNRRRALFSLFVVLLLWSCNPDKNEATNNRLFAKDNLVAWCVVPFDSVDRTPEQRATMLDELGFKQFAYDWRLKHLPTFPDEIKSLKDHDIKLTSVWVWIDTDSTMVLDETNEQLFEMIKENNVKTDLWLGFSNKHF